MISYEGSKWYVKIWRARWYLYAILLYLKEYISIDVWLEFFMNEGFEDDVKKKFRAEWKDIKKHVELSKMYKFSAK
jgi:hypothetical protein